MANELDTGAGVGVSPTPSAADADPVHPTTNATAPAPSCRPVAGPPVPLPAWYKAGAAVGSTRVQIVWFAPQPVTDTPLPVAVPDAMSRFVRASTVMSELTNWPVAVPLSFITAT